MWEKLHYKDLHDFELVDLLLLDVFDSVSIVAPWSECENIVALSIIKVAHPCSKGIIIICFLCMHLMVVHS